jgi:LuxR family quorum-sensing system transcriptional regulator CciR
MLLLDLIGSFADALDMFDSQEALASAVSTLSSKAGFAFFAISHHADFASAPADLIHLHNYPADFAGYHDRDGLGVRDPVHRASQLRGSGFLWSALPGLLQQLTSEDRLVLARAEAAGIGPGYTRPFHVPGERSGSSSFAMRTGADFPKSRIAIAEALGAFAFEAARSFSRRRNPAWIRQGWLTERERQIVIWLGHGMGEKEVARRLSISPSTVNDHLKHARAKFGIHKSSLLVVCALLTGAIGYSELLTG